VKQITRIARKLRNQMTDAEKVVWYFLRSKQVGGLKFRRQEPIGSYIVDFVCFEVKLIIEVDGGQHAKEVLQRDMARDRWLRLQGFTVLRFWNNEALQNKEGVFEEIKKFCNPPSPSPSHQGRGIKNGRQQAKS
jgi:very-short-patch-repair endonuclease